jgi:hypothetical protein
MAPYPTRLSSSYFKMLLFEYSVVNVPIYEKGDHLRCKNYRGIILLNTVYKIVSKILSERLRPKIEAVLGWYQTGYREEKGTVGQIHTLWQILERMKEQNPYL